MEELNTLSAENNIEESLLTVQEMANFLNVKVGTLKDWTKLKENPCPCYRYRSRTLRFEKSEVLDWFKNETRKWNQT